MLYDNKINMTENLISDKYVIEEKKKKAIH